jgi:hypothetical protein
MRIPLLCFGAMMALFFVGNALCVSSPYPVVKPDPQAWFTRTLPGSPDGYYEFFHYNTSFQRKTQAAESVTLTKESGHWQVSGYRFR